LSHGIASLGIGCRFKNAILDVVKYNNRASVPVYAAQTIRIDFEAENSHDGTNVAFKYLNIEFAVYGHLPY